MKARRSRIVSSAVVALAALAVAVPVALAGTSTNKGSLSAGDTVQTDRLFRDANPSTCNTEKSNPGLFGDGSTQHVDAYSFWNATNQIQCVTVRLFHSCGPADVDNINAFAVAYADSLYDPSDPAAAWAADAGQSSSPEQFGFRVGPFQSFEVVVSTVEEGEVIPPPPPPAIQPFQAPAGTGCVSYTLTVQIGKSATQPAFRTIVKPKWKWAAYDHRLTK